MKNAEHVKKVVRTWTPLLTIPFGTYQLISDTHRVEEYVNGELKVQDDLAITVVLNGGTAVLLPSSLDSRIVITAEGDLVVEVLK